MLGAGTVRNASEVTTPKLPAPAPRRAQNSSGSRVASHSIRRPFARTIWAPIRWSEVTPYFLPRIPSPPPRVSPATPTSGQVPAGMARPCSWSDSYTPPRRAPAPTVATPPETDTEPIGVTSMTTPRLTERPAKQWPPLRVAHSNPCRRTKAIVSETSWGGRAQDDGLRPYIVEPGVERLGPLL